MKKPLIAISCGCAVPANSVTPSHSLTDTYVKAVERAGGIPVIMPCFANAALAAEFVDRVDGVLFSGGADVDALARGTRATKTHTKIQPRRDFAEIAACRYAMEKTNKPILGICRGIQLINFAMGGTLVEDLPSAGKLEHQMSMYPANMESHYVKVDPETRIGKLMGKEQVGVNSYHHQACLELAPGFIAGARSIPDDVIESIELPGDRFVLGTQWHPEGMVDTDCMANIFSAFIAAASEQ